MRIKGTVYLVAELQSVKFLLILLSLLRSAALHIIVIAFLCQLDFIFAVFSPHFLLFVSCVCHVLVCQLLAIGLSIWPVWF